MKRYEKKLHLKEKPTMKNSQDYVHQLEIERGFLHQTVLQKCLMLGEETGELFKAVRKSENISVDPNSKIGSVSEELVDIFIYLCAIANRYNIHLEDAFRQKEEINKKRKWEVKS